MLTAPPRIVEQHGPVQAGVRAVDEGRGTFRRRRRRWCHRLGRHRVALAATPRPGHKSRKYGAQRQARHSITRRHSWRSEVTRVPRPHFASEGLLELAQGVSLAQRFVIRVDAPSSTALRRTGIGLNVGVDLATHRVTRVGPGHRRYSKPRANERADGAWLAAKSRHGDLPRSRYFFGGRSRNCNRRRR